MRVLKSMFDGFGKYGQRWHLKLEVQSQLHNDVWFIYAFKTEGIDCIGDVIGRQLQLAM